MLTLAKRGEGVWLAGFKQIPGLSLVTKPPLFLLLLLIVEARWRTDGLTSEAVFFLLNTGVVVPWLRGAELFPDEPKICDGYQAAVPRACILASESS